MEKRYLLKTTTVYTLVRMLTVFVTCQDQGPCVQLSECSCLMKDGSGVVDISSLGNRDGTPLFQDIKSADGYVYSYNPCGGFSEGVCSNAAVCKKDLSSGQSIEIGRAVGAEFSYDEDTDQIVVIYTAGQLGELHTFTYLLCEQSTNPGPPQFYPNGTIDTNLFLTTLYSACACPGRCDENGVKVKSSFLGIGWIICIGIGGIIILYLVLGTVYMKVVKKASGTDLIPNKEFWKTLPKNIKTGPVYLYKMCTGRKENYSDMK